MLPSMRGAWRGALWRIAGGAPRKQQLLGGVLWRWLEGLHWLKLKPRQRRRC